MCGIWIPCLLYCNPSKLPRFLTQMDFIIVVPLTIIASADGCILGRLDDWLSQGQRGSISFQAFTLLLCLQELNGLHYTHH